MILFVAVIVMILFAAGCMSSEQAQQLDDATEAVWSGVESGEISFDDARVLIAEIQEVSGSGVPWWEIALSVLGGVALRGVPSKGPLKFLGSFLSK